MNDLFYIEYQPKIMLVDALDMAPEVELAHRRLCDFIWAMDKAPDDVTDKLVELCRATPQTWSRIRGELELKGWHTEGGKFTHNGTIETLMEAKERHRKACERTQKANEVRWGDKRNETRNVASDDKRNVPVTDHVTRSQLELESELELSTKTVGANESHPTASNWLERLIADPTYTGIDVRTEHGKMLNWCRVHRKKATERRFVNWLNRIEKPEELPKAPASGPSLSKVKAYAQEKWGDDSRWQNWACSFHAYWADPKRNWRHKDGRTVDWMIELGVQVAKWRTQA